MSDKITNYVLFYDRSIRLWTLFFVDADDNQLSEALYFTTKKQGKIEAQKTLRQRA